MNEHFAKKFLFKFRSGFYSFVTYFPITNFIHPWIQRIRINFKNCNYTNLTLNALTFSNNLLQLLLHLLFLNLMRNSFQSFSLVHGISIRKPMWDLKWMYRNRKCILWLWRVSLQRNRRGLIEIVYKFNEFSWLGSGCDRLIWSTVVYCSAKSFADLKGLPFSFEFVVFNVWFTWFFEWKYCTFSVCYSFCSMNF